MVSIIARIFFVCVLAVAFSWSTGHAALECCECKRAGEPNTWTGKLTNTGCGLSCAGGLGFGWNATGGPTYELENGLFSCGDDCSNTLSDCFVPGQDICNEEEEEFSDCLFAPGLFVCKANTFLPCPEDTECNCDNWDGQTFGPTNCLCEADTVAARAVPKKANKFQASVVQGVQVCEVTIANTTAPGILGTPACDPVVPSDPGCVFEQAGSGKIALKSKTDISIQAKLGKIEQSCEGETLCVVASFTSSSDTCASGGDCTSVALVDQPLGSACCQVAKGKCKIKTTLNTALPGALVVGQRTEFQLGEVGVLRNGFPAVTPGTRTNAAFRAGLLLP